MGHFTHALVIVLAVLSIPSHSPKKPPEMPASLRGVENEKVFEVNGRKCHKCIINSRQFAQISGSVLEGTVTSVDDVMEKFIRFSGETDRERISSLNCGLL